MRERNWIVSITEHQVGECPRQSHFDDVEFDNRKEAEAYARDFNRSQSLSESVYYKANATLGSRQ